MTTPSAVLRRALAGPETGVAFAVLVAGALLVPGGFVPSYLALLLASAVRNVHAAWLGAGPGFYALAGLFLYLQAVLAAGTYRAFRGLVGRGNFGTAGQSG